MSEATNTADELEPDAPPVDPDAAEPDPADDGTDLEPDPVEADPVEPDNAPSAQALMEALEKEHRRHQNAVAKALGIDPADMHECPTCEGVGFTPEPIGQEVELVRDPFTETCERCKGNGEVLTGATHRGLYSIPCNGCSGSGYVTKPEQPDAGANLGNEGNGSAVYAPPAIASTQDAAMVAALRAQGYTILEPITVPPPVPA